jgi:hypothetical protein
MAVALAVSRKDSPSKLAALGRFSGFKPESERQVRKTEVKADPNLRTLKDLFERFQFIGIRSRDFPAADHTAACRLLKTRIYSSTQIMAFSLVLPDLEKTLKVGNQKSNQEIFKAKSGILFSALINRSPDYDFRLFSHDIAHAMDYLGSFNTKNIRICGDAGHHLGRSMQRGTITVEGNAGDHLGDEMMSGKIIVMGNSGASAGGMMNGGSIEIFGNAAHGLGEHMVNGKIHVHGDAGQDIAAHAKNARISIDGDIGEFGERYTSALIYHKGKLVRKGPFI